MAWHNELGRWGEQVAADYLVSKGWFIRHRDWRNNHRDLDIVCIDADMTTILIVEVKTRATDEFGAPQDAVDLQKKNNILRAAAAYTRMYHLEHLNIRYDIISVIGTPPEPVDINHIEDAFDITANYYYKEQQRKRYHYRKKPGCW